MVSVGFLKGNVINFTFNGQGFILPQTPTFASDTPADVNIIQYFFTNPKWFSSLFFLVVFMLLTGGIIFLIFLKASYFKFTCLIYIALTLFSFIILEICNISGISKTGYTIAQNFKELLLSPFIGMFLIPAFTIHEKYVNI